MTPAAPSVSAFDKARGDADSIQGSTGRRRAAAVLAACLTTACGAPLLKLPSGPGAPAPDAADAFTQATLACRAVSSITAEVGVSGSISGRRMRARLIVGVAAPASARLEAFAFSQQLFIFVARGGDATLYLPREGRALQHGRPDEVLEAVTGVPLDAAGLRLTLTGCAPPSAGAVTGRQLGEDWRVVTERASDLYLRRESRAAPWRLVAAVQREPGRLQWRAEYREFENGLPRSIRLVSADRRRFDLHLVLSQVDINVPLEAAAFEVRIPPGTQPITVEELRDSGPLSSAR
jgi:hypothetical protein